ncbi:MAG: alkaline phosphatase family protein [Actinomycetota bacterium]
MGLAGEENLLGIESSTGREIFFLIDGFGQFIFEEFASDIPVISAFEEFTKLQAHFPSTTVTNLTSIGTGRYPCDHGMVGYTMRIPWSQPGTPALLNGLKWDERIDPLTWQEVPTLFERARLQGFEVSHIASARYEGSGFTRAALRGPTYLPASSDDEIISALQSATKTTPSFTYLYLNDVDDAGHATGVGSNRWKSALMRVNALIERISRELPSSTRLWITADHGMINAGEKVVIGKGNNLMDEVEILGGEPRARNLYLKRDNDGAIDENVLNRVRQRWSDFFGERIEILTPEEGYGSNLNAKVRSRIGEIIIVPKDQSVLIEPEREETQMRMVGHHGSITKAELEIPLRVMKL